MGIKSVVQTTHAARNWAGQNSDNLGCLGLNCRPMASPVRHCKEAMEKERKRQE
jgi:hypothetical protein